MYTFIFSGTRLFAIDDELRTKATEYIQTKFAAIKETREFLALPVVKLEIIGKNNKNFFSLTQLFMKIRF